VDDEAVPLVLQDLTLTIGDVAAVIACLLALRMVRALSERQSRRAAELCT